MRTLRKILIVLIPIIIVFVVIGSLIMFSRNYRTRKFGGTIEIQLTKDQKFINATWKENDLWYLYEDSTQYIFQERSSLGLLNGKVIFKK